MESLDVLRNRLIALLAEHDRLSDINLDGPEIHRLQAEIKTVLAEYEAGLKNA